jgi:hypothetical protein
MRHKSGGAESGALSADSCTVDPDLARIIAAWPTLIPTPRVATVNAARRPSIGGFPHYPAAAYFPSTSPGRIPSRNGFLSDGTGGNP